MPRIDILHVNGDNPDSYPVFIDSANVIKSCLGKLGFESDVIFKPDKISGRTIVLGANLTNHAKREHFTNPDDIIVYNFEQYGSPWMDSKSYLDTLKSVKVLDYSLINASFLKNIGCNVHLCEFGYDECLETIESLPETKKDIDVLFVGSLNERRGKILKEIADRDANVFYVFKTTNEERDKLISRSKVLINIHYYEAKILPSLRIVPILANKGFVLNETGRDEYLDDQYNDMIAWADYDSLADAAMEFIGDADSRDSIRLRGHELIKSRPYIDNLKSSLAHFGWL